MRRKILAAVILAAVATSASAATLDLSSGATVSVPEGWRGAAAAGGMTASLVGPDGDSTVIVSLTPATRAEIEAQIAAPIDLGGGIVLTPMGQPQRAGEDYLADYSVTGTSKPARGVVRIRALPGGRGFALVGIVPVAAVEELRRVQGQIMASAQFRAAAPAAGWANYLRGRYIAQIYTGNGYQEKREMWFCSDGTFASAAEGGGFTPGVASGAFGSNSSGTWSATGETSGEGAITLQRNDGQRGQLRVAMNADALFLNGERWLRGDNTRCR